MGCKKYARFTFHFIIKDKRENRNTPAIYFTFYVPCEGICDIVTVKNGLKKKKKIECKKCKKM